MAKKNQVQQSWHLRRLADRSFEIYTRSTGLFDAPDGSLAFRSIETVIYRADQSNKQLAAYVTIGDSIEIAPIKIQILEKLPF